MKVVILAGGKGTRLAEETETTPKVMVEIGGQPLLWHIARHYARHGFQEIFVALGYKGEVVRQHAFALDAKLHLVDTGAETATGGRLRRLREQLGHEPFMVTYGDGVSDIDLAALRDFHRAHGLIATLSAVQPPQRFGRLVCDGDLVTRFAEKPAPLHPDRRGNEKAAPNGRPTEPASFPQDWINGGFFVFEPALFDLIPGDEVSLEVDVLPQLAAARQLKAYRHHGFWQCMDTLHEKRLLQELWSAGDAPWKVWAD